MLLAYMLPCRAIGEFRSIYTDACGLARIVPVRPRPALSMIALLFTKKSQTPQGRVDEVGMVISEQHRGAQLSSSLHLDLLTDAR